MLEDVYAADWSPDGKELAVARWVGGKSRLEFPIGTIIYESPGELVSPRVSKRGEVAFARHPPNALAGDLLLVEPNGSVRTLVEGWGHKGAGVVALAWSPSEDEILPTGKGRERGISIEPLAEVTLARWFPDGARIALAGREREGSGYRFYVLDLAGGSPRPVSAPGIGASFLAVSPDGRMLAGVDRQGLLALFGVDGEEPRAVPGASKGSVPVGWTRDGGLLVIPEAATRPVLSRVDVSTGRIDPITTLEPTDPIGIRAIRRVFMTPDERTVVFGYGRLTGYLNLVESPRAP